MSKKQEALLLVGAFLAVAFVGLVLVWGLSAVKASEPIAATFQVLLTIGVMLGATMLIARAVLRFLNQRASKIES